MTPLLTLSRSIDRFSEALGRTIAWAALIMVLVQFTVVLMRYIFGIGSIWAQESVVYLHALLFMLAAGYTLLHNAHVRVDIFYREASPRYKAWVDILGTLFFLWPVCILIVVEGWPYVSLSWSVMEGSRETSGIQAVFLLKSVILAFAALVALQGISLLTHAARVLSGAEQPAAEETSLL